MNSISTRKLGHANDFINRKIAFNRSEITREMRSTTDLIAFVCFKAMQ